VGGGTLRFTAPANKEKDGKWRGQLCRKTGSCRGWTLAQTTRKNIGGGEKTSRLSKWALWGGGIGEARKSSETVVGFWGGKGVGNFLEWRHRGKWEHRGGSWRGFTIHRVSTSNIGWSKAIRGRTKHDRGGRGRAGYSGVRR